MNKKSSRSIRGIEGRGGHSQRPTTKRAPVTARSGRTATKTVADVMVTDVVTLPPQSTLVEAALTMQRANVGMLLVVESGEVRGVITDRDIVVRAIARNADLSTTRVDECLTDDVICAHPDWTTDQAMKAMADARVGRLPVVDRKSDV